MYAEEFEELMKWLMPRKILRCRHAERLDQIHNIKLYLHEPHIPVSLLINIAAAVVGNSLRRSWT